jgi:hypothetical protein
MKMDPAQNSPISTNGIDDIPNDPGYVYFVVNFDVVYPTMIFCLLAYAIKFQSTAVK